MRRHIILLILLSGFFSLHAQEKSKKLPDTFLGYGWVVGFPYDIAFIPSERPDTVPTSEDYFVQRNKYGIRLNDEEKAIEALRKARIYPIKWHTGEKDSLEIIPVMAYYSLRYIDYARFRIDTSKVKFEPYSEMLQVYSYKGKTDSVFYRFGMYYNLELRVLGNH